MPQDGEIGAVGFDTRAQGIEYLAVLERFWVAWQLPYQIVDPNQQSYFFYSYQFLLIPSK